MMLDSGIITSTQSEADLYVTLRGCSCKKMARAEQVELSLDSDIVEALQATGEDWEIHFNAILREWLRSNPAVS